MGFLGVGGLEFLVIFGVAIFIVGPKRLAEGVRTGRKYYTELKRQRDELTAMVTEAIDAEELRKDFEETKREAWDESATKSIAGIENDLTLDQGDLDLGLYRPVAVDETASKPSLTKRGSGRINGKDVPDMGIGPEAAPEAESRGAE